MSKRYVGPRHPLDYKKGPAGPVTLGYAQLDGTTGYINTPLVTSGEAQWSMSAWAWADAVSGTEYLWATRDGGNVGFTLTMDYLARCRTSVTGLVSIGGTYVGDGVWVHYASTYDGSEFIFYINGTPSAPTPQTGTIVGAGALQFGTFNGVSLFGGRIRDAYAYNVGLTPDQVTFLATEGASGTDPGTANLISNWPMDGNADDVFGSNNGTIVGGVTF